MLRHIVLGSFLVGIGIGAAGTGSDASGGTGAETGFGAKGASLWAIGAGLGPPTICFPIEIGKAESLPFGDEAKGGKYLPYARVEGDRTKRETVRFIADVVNLLGKEAEPLVRMETLRRATFYAYGMAEAEGTAPAWAADRLMSEVLGRALDAEAGQDSARVLACWLDAAWLRGCYSDLGEHASTRAYDWLQRGLKLGGKDVGAYDFAAAVLTMHAKALGRDGLEGYHAEHVRRAARKAEDGSLLATNLLSRFGGEGATLAKLRGP